MPRGSSTSAYKQAIRKLRAYTNLQPYLGRRAVNHIVYKRKNAIVIDFDLLPADLELTKDCYTRYVDPKTTRLIVLPNSIKASDLLIREAYEDVKDSVKLANLGVFKQFVSNPEAVYQIAVNYARQLIKLLGLKFYMLPNLSGLRAKSNTSKLLPNGLFYFNSFVLVGRYRQVIVQLFNTSSTNQRTVQFVRFMLAWLNRLVDVLARGSDSNSKLKLLNIKFDLGRYIQVYGKSERLDLDSVLRKSVIGSIIYQLRKYKSLPVDKFDAVTLTIRLSDGATKIVTLCIGGECASYQRIINLIKGYALKTINEPQFLQKLEQLKQKTIKLLKSILSRKLIEQIGEGGIEQIADTVVQYAADNPDVLLEATRINQETIRDILVQTIEEEEEVPVETRDLEKLVRKLLEIKPPRWQVPYYSEVQKALATVENIGSAHTARPILLEEGFKEQLKLFNYTFKNVFNVAIIKLKRKPVKLNDIETTIVDRYVLTIKDFDTGRVYEKEVYLPRLIEGKYFIHNGRKRTILYQIFQKPIFAAKPFEVLIRSIFTTLTIKSKIKSKRRALVTYIMGREVPLSTVLLAYYCDLQGVIEKFGGKIVIADTPVDKAYSIQLDNGKWLSLDVANSSNVAKQFFWGIIVELGKKYKLPQSAINSCEFWSNLITHKYGGRYLRTIKQGLDLLIDPTTKVVLEAEKLPTNTFDVIKYAAELAITGKVDNLTDLRNRRIRTSEAIAQVLFKHLYMALKKYDMERQFKKAQLERLDIKIEPDYLIKQLTTRALQSQYQLIQDLNPLIESEYFSRITYAGLQGVGGRKATADMRTVHPTMYGSIDPIDTPDSANVGIVRHLALDADISSGVGKFAIKPFGAPGVNIFSISGSQIPMALHNDGNRVQFANAQFKSDIKIVGAEPPQVLSGYETLVAYTSSNDFALKSPCDGKVLDVIEDRYIVVDCKKGKKVLLELAVKGVTDAVGIVQKPLVKPGDSVKQNQILAADPKFFHSEYAIYGTGVNAYTLQMPFKVWNYEDAIVVSETFAKKLAKSVHIQKIPVKIDKVYRIKYIVTEERPDLIGTGQIQVKKSQPLLILRPANLKAFQLRLQESLDTYPDGYERFRDSIAREIVVDYDQLLADLVRQRLARYEAKLVESRAQQSFNYYLNEFFGGETEDTEGVLDVLEQPEQSETEEEGTTTAEIQEAVISEADDISDESALTTDDTIGEDESLVEADFSGVTVYPPFDGIIVEIEVYAKDEDTLKQYPELYELWKSKRQKLRALIDQLKSKGVDTSALEQHWVFHNFGLNYKGEPIENVLVIYHVYGEKDLELADKLHNRHGNKGTVSLIVPDDQMPRDPDGRPFELIMNPTGVISRKNVGQLMEMFITKLVRHVYDKEIKPLIDANKYEQAVDAIIRFYRKFYQLDPKHEFAQVGEHIINQLEQLKKNKTELKAYIDYIRKYNLPIITPPITRTNLRNVEQLMREYGLKARDYVYLPDLGQKSKLPVAFGWVYWFKTVHMASKKIHARSIGRYSRSMQATAGKSKEGGQRLGELEVFGLIAWDAKGVLTEFLTLGADDIKTKMDAYQAIIEKGEVSFLEFRSNPLSKTSQKLRVLLECLHIVEPQD